MKEQQPKLTIEQVNKLIKLQREENAKNWWSGRNREITLEDLKKLERKEQNEK